MKIQNSLGDLHSESSSLFPCYGIISILNVGPKRAFGAILKYDTIMRLHSNSAKKHNNMRMPNSLHRMTLTKKIPQTNIPILNLKLLHHHTNLPPLGLKNQPKPALINLRLQLKLRPFYLNIRIKPTILGYTLQLEV